jgi:hypothetical protein
MMTSLHEAIAVTVDFLKQTAEASKMIRVCSNGSVLQQSDAGWH